MKSPRITSNQREQSMLIRCQNWKQFKSVMEGISATGAESRFGTDVLSVRIMRVNRFNISVPTVKGWCK